ncbi:MAG TPA: D-glycero-beta-D-manno-heptose 1-phosphate adenylyltransferase [Candidatus Marinimicrobia bacterium]|jgi:D-beta-D-heptose 7-phosphate kinase/D-beta-D-heptose 1-phosphate adenosyltransferase|nr:D-glycero-beta-D-manno-heptose 1-phosphate adenylyltransferase [Candidatus Neomarinimicrobiota bacterium]MDP6296027.1 D-glycero-beta-D-manno-heptose 1-phosphate adenylyltransferase [Candidatus Neomarinimicrobiota bacterium]MDP7122126.1 D-glycero-beta-D-manno-heptose 1-phosphate adenylyltransferase [Candidatus Neomarinimicrobiota bacterium]MDP7484028.1 D-glycero-beta-D-manno-heptose 1-phosphate adenylyltransferase [Candidatus Neomarinimicrobiota bacterium]MDP7528920.1 D-glycero-beta-D-manno-h
MTLLNREETARRATEARDAGKIVVFTNGCFDLLHSGHVTLLEVSAGEGDLLLVGLNSDSSVRRLKGVGRPVQPEAERAEALLDVEAVNVVTIFSEDTPLELIESIKPDVLVKGGDYSKDEIVGSDIVLSRGGEVVRVPLLQGISTTRIIKERVGKEKTKRT